MTGDLDDLVPLFLEEAAARLERLSGLLTEARDDADAAVQVRRELHALKGAGRLMGLTDVAELCHEAEDVLLSDVDGSLAQVRGIVEEVGEIVEDLGVTTVDETVSPESDDDEHVVRRAAIRGGSGELRVATDVVDGLAERSVRMRVATRSGAAPVQRLFELARVAEQKSAEKPREGLADLAADLRRTALELERVNGTLHRLGEAQMEAVLRIQVQPLRPFLRTLERHTRELARSLGKEVEVTTAGGEVQLDRRILEAIREAALHLAHNAVDHGLEEPKERRHSGKSPIGRIHFSALADGDRVRLVVWDDGRGIDPNAVVQLAVERGLVNPTAAAKLTPEECYQLLELPGFSTRAMATDVSGRGVGLDAVAATFRSIGGDLWIRSSTGEGTRVTVEVPVARRGERVLVVEVGNQVLALPSTPVRSFDRVRPEMMTTVEGRTLIRRRSGEMGAVPLASLLGETESSAPTMVEVSVAGRDIAVIVDSIVGEEEVFIRPLPKTAGAPSFVEGIALLGSGSPVAVLSLQRLGPLELEELGESARDDEVGRIHVLLTDDTPATREMLRRLLEDAGFRVTSVVRAEEALQLIEKEPFDCVITGVDLPGLNGIDLTRKVRSSDLYGDLPVVIVSTRDRPADRLEGLEAGADAYLTKRDLDPTELAELVRRITRR
ncbi:MAG: response regulator [Thermoanaerobaculales bacterium]|jgi:chemotaxis protein histidine kinase CheA|nr:response regulator [Thermoanaerobaculales bacterium]